MGFGRPHGQPGGDQTQPQRPEAQQPGAQPHESEHEVLERRPIIEARVHAAGGLNEDSAHLEHEGAEHKRRKPRPSRHAAPLQQRAM